MLEYGYNSKREDKPYIEHLSVTYCQDPDNNQNQDECQYIKLTTEDSGGGPYIRISIPNDGMIGKDKEGFWSVTDVSDLFKIFEDFKQKLNWVPGEFDNKKEFYNAPPISLVKEILYKYVNDYGKANVEEGAKYIVNNW